MVSVIGFRPLGLLQLVCRSVRLPLLINYGAELIQFADPFHIQTPAPAPSFNFSERGVRVVSVAPPNASRGYTPANPQCTMMPLVYVCL